MVWLTLVGCDTFFTEQPPAGEDFESPLDGLDPETARMFAKGDENFEHVFSVDEGVGPIFNNMSCSGCHPGDGRATPNEALVRFSMGTDLVPELGGPQLQDRAIPGSQPETLPPGADRSLRLPPFERRGVYYTAGLHDRRVCATHCRDVSVVCRDIEPRLGKGD